ncbi:MAG: T9SS type A sorting domain-containing protein [Pyrinomonadaceae bacterium]|nr:T9SS type A sorting domain-containing protein [Sphingobacteriaceae bacterium]
MKRNYYPEQANKNSFAYLLRVTLLFTFLSTAMLLPEAKAQGLVFKNSILQSGVAGQVDAVYRFPAVTTNVDALVKISGRSSSLVTLVSIDLPGMGFEKSFQPKVSYNNGTTPVGISDWWMEFTITFVNSITSVPVNVNTFSLTALDIDGNADKINEWVTFYNHKTYTLENNTLLQYASVWELVSNISTLVGTQCTGPVTNFVDIDTAATSVMASASYQNMNGMRVRTGGHSTGQSGASDRMYSFWFKSFSYQAPIESGLPVNLKSFTATLDNKKPVMNWVSSVESNLSHYALERSVNGSDFSEIAIIFANENSTVDSKYGFTDNAVPAASKGIVYYRLRMVDMDTKYKYSETRLVRIGDAAKMVTIQAYPNPAINELRVTIPNSWQNKKVQYEIYSVSGQSIRRSARNNASQTEVMDISQLTAGSYIIKVFAENETATQQFVKSK